MKVSLFEYKLAAIYIVSGIRVQTTASICMTPKGVQSRWSVYQALSRQDPLGITYIEADVCILIPDIIQTAAKL